MLHRVAFILHRIVQHAPPIAPPDTLPKSKRRSSVSRPMCFGGSNEWHLDLSKSAQYLKFGLVSAFHEKIVLIGSAFSESRFKTAGLIGDSVSIDSIQ